MTITLPGSSDLRSGSKLYDPMEDTHHHDLTVIGRAERVDLPKFGISRVPAKIDTGADSSSIWASDVHATVEALQFKLFGPGSEFYSGETLTFSADDFDVAGITNSFGEREERYKVKLTIRVKGRLVKGSFTLADRSTMAYPMLLGRRLLSGKFVVDVKAGEPLSKKEKLKRLLKEIGGKG